MSRTALAVFWPCGTALSIHEDDACKLHSISITVPLFTFVIFWCMDLKMQQIRLHLNCNIILKPDLYNFNIYLQTWSFFPTFFFLKGTENIIIVGTSQAGASQFLCKTHRPHRLWTQNPSIILEMCWLVGLMVERYFCEDTLDPNVTALFYRY